MSTGPVLTNQQMFDRAWHGLKSQGWRPSHDGMYCMYKMEDGRRCAWGWVDPEGTAKVIVGTVRQLHREGKGLAALLDPDGLKFAEALQLAHDAIARNLNPDKLETAMRNFAQAQGLRVPED